MTATDTDRIPIPINQRKRVEKIVENISPERVVLFDSQATGKATEDSDIDLLVVWDTSLKPAEGVRHISRLISPRPGPLDIVVRTPGELDKARHRVEPFLSEVLEKGISLYARW